MWRVSPVRALGFSDPGARVPFPNPTLSPDHQDLEWALSLFPLPTMKGEETKISEIEPAEEDHLSRPGGSASVFLGTSDLDFQTQEVLGRRRQVHTVWPHTYVAFEFYTNYTLLTSRKDLKIT